jgi:hypothetical protein
MDTTSKAASHSVTPSPEGFVVVSGTSGKSYLVAPLATGGAHCNCAHGRHSSAIASRCSHVAAVEAFAARVLAEQAEADKPQAVRCWLCDGTGRVEVRQDYLDPRSNRWIEKPSRFEPCLNCGGIGSTRKGD